MTNNNQYLHWLTLEEGKPVNFSDLAHLMAKAMHQGDDESFSYAAARINLEDELKQAVKDGSLMVRNPAGLGCHTLPIGAALQDAVLIPNIDLPSFLKARGMGLRLTPHGEATQPQPKPKSANEWVPEAQNRARGIIKEQRARDLYPSQENMADQIATEFRQAGKVGADGKPISGAYIKRHALKGITSAYVKQLSASKRQSK